jgi:hypothetical protein
VVLRHHHHRQAEDIREQDELLALVVALLAGGGEKLDALEPLLLGELDVARERVQMLDEARDDLLEPAGRSRPR